MDLLFEKYRKEDITIIKEQLRCKNVFVGGIVERCVHGFPQIILLNPVKRNNEINNKKIELN